MTDEKTVTEREAIERERAAWIAGAAYWDPGRLSPSRPSLEDYANSKYPMPKVTRPRVLLDPSYQVEWRVVSGKIECRVVGDTAWTSNTGRTGNTGNIWNPIPNRVALWADLFDRPDEEVDE